MDFLDPELKNIRFRVAHRVLALNVYLCGRNIATTYNCVFCKNARSPETYDHFFLECGQITRVWDFLRPILLGLCNHRLKLDRDTVMFGQLSGWKNIPVVKRELIIYFYSLAMHAAWSFRFSVKNGFGPVAEEGALRVFKSNLKFRIQADFSRLPELTFLDYWAKEGVLCKVEDESLRFTF